jgi:hypothetical protein
MRRLECNDHARLHGHISILGWCQKEIGKTVLPSALIIRKVNQPHVPKCSLEAGKDIAVRVRRSGAGQNGQ